jgi:hypothetical protein
MLTLSSRPALFTVRFSWTGSEFKQWQAIHGNGFCSGTHWKWG